MKLEERIDRAGELLRDRKYAKATEEYAWLWDNILRIDDSLCGLRAGFVADEMRELAAAHPPAMQRFRALRDDAERRLVAIDPDLRDDWIMLNEVVGDEQRTLAWFDRVKDDPRSTAELEHSGFRLRELLAQHERWVEFGRLVSDPLAEIHSAQEFLDTCLDQDVPAGMEEEWNSSAYETFREKSGQIYGAMLAVNREKDAARVAAEAIKLDDSGPMRVSLVEWALRMKQARKEQVKWLEEAGEKGEAVEGLREDLEDKLK